jgi:hypothetical protein
MKLLPVVKASKAGSQILHSNCFSSLCPTPLSLSEGWMVLLLAIQLD